MRWLVEVTSIGKTDCQSFVLDAESWQRALQTTRTMRGETGPMSGFSIELLEAGFRAVDPMARLIYVVKRAPDDVPLTQTPSTAPSRPATIAPPPQASNRPPAPGVVVAPTPIAAAPAPAVSPSVAPGPPRPDASPPRPGGSVAPAPLVAKKKTPQTLVFASSGSAATSDAPAPMPVAAASLPVPIPAPALLPVGLAAPQATAAIPEPDPDAEIPSAAITDRELPRDGALSEQTPNVGHLEDAPTYVDKGSQPDLADASGANAQPDPRLLADAPPTQVIFKREQEPNAASPLTYREYVYAVATNTPEDDAERVLRAQFELVKRALGDRKAGKLVNLAVFDVVFQGKPPVPPLATLVWKDWKGEPVVEFPRRRPVALQPARVSNRPPAGNAPDDIPIPQPMPMAATHAPSGPLMAGPPPPALWGPPPVGFPASNPAILPIAVAAPFFAPQGVPAPAAIPQPQQASPPNDVALSQPAAIPQRFTPPPGRLSAGSAGLTPNPDRPSRTFNRAPAVRGRATGDELITALFEAMHDLHFLRDAIEGAEFCLALALDTLPSRAGLVHLYDIDKREFVIACANGTGTEKLLLKRHSEAEPMLASAMRRRRAIVYANATNEADALTERFEVLGGAKSLIIAPVMQSGRFLGVIEIINPLDSAPFTEDEGAAVSYIAEQYAEFVASRGVVTDAERISLRTPNVVR